MSWMMSSVSGSAYDFAILKRVLVYVKPYKKTFYLTTLLTILLGVLSPVRPWLIQYTIDNHVLNSDYQGLVNFIILMLVMLVAESYAQFFHTYYSNWLGQSVIKDLRTNLYNRISGFRLKYYDHTPIGTLVTRVISDIETIADIFSEGLLLIIADLLKLFAVIAVMFYTDWRLTLISLSSIPILLMATWWFKNAVKAAFQDVRTQVARLNAFVQEHITGMNIVQIFNREEQELKKFKKINEQHRDANIRSIWAYSIFFPVVEVLSALSVALLVWLGAKEVLAGTTSFGTLVAFILYIHMLYRPIRQLADRFNVLQMGMVSSERVFRLFDTDSRIEDNGIIEAKNIQGLVEFKNVWFSYRDADDQAENGEEWILKDVSFSVNKGEKIAFVGATGAGKTSIINLLNRFYEFAKGEILIDKRNIRDYELSGLRSNIGVVLQDVFLFSDTIMNNITLKNDAISEKEVIAAAKKVGVHDFIMGLKGAYEYDVKERGGMLSVGQRQLIAFLRAYVYNPSILILDEATSSIDTHTEQVIQYATEKLTENRTSIVIAHRLATIQKADKIIVLDKGKIVEEGNHQQLLKKNGHYKKLYELQFKESEILE